MKRSLQVLRDCLKKNRVTIILVLFASAGFPALLGLYGMMTEPVLYALVLLLFAGLVLLTVDFVLMMKAAGERERLVEAPLAEWMNMPDGETLEQRDLTGVIRALGAEEAGAEERFTRDRQEMLDYYTAWVHQIKTPIAVMKLKLSGDDPETKALLSELFRVERYAGMALEYIRLGSAGNDLVISEQDADELIRESVHRLIPVFVEKKLYLHFSGTGKRVITDRKWFSCILDQLLDNAVKYTNEGGVTVTAAGNAIQISDTGRGIAAEDLPRIFEHGYTGVNGRAGENSSGLGLYLAKRAAELIGVRLEVTSTPGKGSTFSVVFENTQIC